MNEHTTFTLDYTSGVFNATYNESKDVVKFDPVGLYLYLIGFPLEEIIWNAGFDENRMSPEEYSELCNLNSLSRNGEKHKQEINTIINNKKLNSKVSVNIV